MPAITEVPGVPDPSRRPVGSGRSIATPPAPLARAGVAPAQARTRVSSPLRKRWHRTPPVARPLGGYSAYGVTFRAPGWVPGRASLVPLAVTTIASAAGIDRLLELFTVRLAPDEIIVAARVDLDDRASANAVEHAASAVDRQLRENHPEIRHVFLDPTDDPDEPEPPAQGRHPNRFP